jgi:hypothetical protein
MINKNRRFLEMALVKKVLRFHPNEKLENVWVPVKEVRMIFEELFRANKIQYK